MNAFHELLKVFSDQKKSSNFQDPTHIPNAKIRPSRMLEMSVPS